MPSALPLREPRCEHMFTAGLCPIGQCKHAEVRPKRLTQVPPPVLVEKTPAQETPSELVRRSLRMADIHKLRAFRCARRWFTHG